MVFIPPSYSFIGDKESSIKLKSVAIQYYNFIAQQTERAGINFINKTLVLSDGSTISIVSKKENIYGHRTGNITINTNPSKISINRYGITFVIADEFEDYLYFNKDKFIFVPFLNNKPRSLVIAGITSNRVIDSNYLMSSGDWYSLNSERSALSFVKEYNNVSEYTSEVGVSDGYYGVLNRIGKIYGLFVLIDNISYAYRYNPFVRNEPTHNAILQKYAANLNSITYSNNNDLYCIIGKDTAIGNSFTDKTSTDLSPNIFSRINSEGGISTDIFLDRYKLTKEGLYNYITKVYASKPINIATSLGSNYLIQYSHFFDSKDIDKRKIISVIFKNTSGYCYDAKANIHVNTVYPNDSIGPGKVLYSFQLTDNSTYFNPVAYYNRTISSIVSQYSVYTDSLGNDHICFIKQDHTYSHGSTSNTVNCIIYAVNINIDTEEVVIDEIYSTSLTEVSDAPVPTNTTVLAESSRVFLANYTDYINKIYILQVDYYSLPVTTAYIKDVTFTHNIIKKDISIINNVITVIDSFPSISYFPNYRKYGIFDNITDLNYRQWGLCGNPRDALALKSIASNFYNYSLPNIVNGRVIDGMFQSGILGEVIKTYYISYNPEITITKVKEQTSGSTFIPILFMINK